MRFLIDSRQARLVDLAAAVFLIAALRDALDVGWRRREQQLGLAVQADAAADAVAEKHEQPLYGTAVRGVPHNARNELLEQIAAAAYVADRIDDLGQARGR